MSRLDVHVIITFEEVFGKEKLPDDRLKYLKGATKKGVLTRLSKINTVYSHLIYHTISWDQQIQILKRIFGDNFRTKSGGIPNKFWERVKHYFDRGATPSIFNRAATLVGIEEILLSSLPNEGDDNLEPINFLKYCLLLNSFLNKYQNIDSVDHNQILDLFPFFGPINEHTVPLYPFSELIRGLMLIKHLKNHESLRKYFLDFENLRGIEFENFFLLILSIISVESGSEGNLFNGRNSEYFFKVLSNNKLIRGRHILEVINIKRNCFYKYDDDNWFLLDYLFLINNFFNSLISMFWFEYLKPNSEISVKRYFGEIGLFFENYTCSILRKCFHFYKHPQALYLDQLKVKFKNNSIEICDFLVKKNKKFLLGEIKSSTLNVKIKYPDNPVEIYKKNQDKFEKDYGIQQIVNAIWLLNENKDVFPIELNEKHKYSVFPIVYASV